MFPVIKSKNKFIASVKRTTNMASREVVKWCNDLWVGFVHCNKNLTRD